MPRSSKWLLVRHAHVNYKYTSDCKVEEKRGSFDDYVEHTDINKLITNLIAYIDANNIEAFQKLLRANYIYPQKQGKRPASYIKEIYPPSREIDFDGVDEEYEKWETRPVAEALFLDHNDRLKALADHIIGCHNETIAAAFIGIFGGGDWNEDIGGEILNEIKKLEDYSNKKGSEKNAYVTSVANDLRTSIEEHTKREVKEDHYKTKLENFKFRIELFTKLHKYDPVFARHQGYKRIVTNIATILFAWIPNLINRIATGQWLFFNKTTTQEKVDGIHKAIGANPNEKMNFKA